MQLVAYHWAARKELLREKRVNPDFDLHIYAIEVTVHARPAENAQGES